MSAAFSSSSSGARAPHLCSKLDGPELYTHAPLALEEVFNDNFNIRPKTVDFPVSTFTAAHPGRKRIGSELLLRSTCGFRGILIFEGR